MDLRLLESATVGKEALGPFRSYLLTRGLVLKFNNKEAVVTDGVGSSVPFPVRSNPNEYDLFSPKTYAQVVDEIQGKLGIKLVGIGGESSYEVVFRSDDWTISESLLSEELLARFGVLERLVRKRVCDAADIAEIKMVEWETICANIEDEISYGKIGPFALGKKIEALKTTEIPMDQAFFVFNATSIAEDMRHALLAACHQFCSLNLGIRTINQGTPPQGATGQTDGPWETRLYSAEVDELSYTYTSSLVACYTALDLLYILFVYLTREPFLNPEFPSKLHFPDAPGRRIFQGGGSALPGDPSKGVLPYAIPNLKVSQFGSLRKTRNALVHNMASDSIRPRVYQGWKLPPVNAQPLQYVQYLSRDIDIEGEPVTHPWVRRFYENQSDAQNSVLEWLELTWQCVFDTTEWLIVRWSNNISSA